jgi:hypothetical protein
MAPRRPKSKSISKSYYRKMFEIEALEPKLLLSAAPIEAPEYVPTENDISQAIEEDISYNTNIKELDLSASSIDMTYLINEDGDVSIGTGDYSLLENGNFAFLNGSLLEFEDTRSVVGSQGADTFVFAEDFVLPDEPDFDFSIWGGEGNDELVVLGEDSTWYITGHDSGNVGNINFNELENLTGGQDNEDTFVLEDSGRLSGGIEGGDGGFDILQVNGSYDHSIYEMTGPQSGRLILDGINFDYAGLEPINILDGTSDVTIDLSKLDDLTNGFSSDDKATLKYDTSLSKLSFSSDDGGFESHSFSMPADSLTIKLGAGNDELSIKEITDFTGSLTIEMGSGDDILTFNNTLSLQNKDLNIDGGTNKGGFLNELVSDENDKVVFSGNIFTHGGDIDVKAEHIEVKDNITIATRQISGTVVSEHETGTDETGASGNINFEANIGLSPDELLGFDSVQFNPVETDFSTSIKIGRNAKILSHTTPVYFDPATISQGTIALNDSGFANADAVIYDSATAEELTYNKTHDFSTSEVADNEIDLGFDHGFTTGTALLYIINDNSAEAPVTGLVSTKVYFAIVDSSSAQTLKLASSFDNAIAGQVLNLSTESSGLKHSLSELSVEQRYGFNTGNISGNEIDLLSEHGIQPGDLLYYEKQDGAAITGLKDKNCYYVMEGSNSNKIMLTDSPDGQAITISSFGDNSVQTLSKLSIASAPVMSGSGTFAGEPYYVTDISASGLSLSGSADGTALDIQSVDAKTFAASDISSNTISFSENHGFKTGDALFYSGSEAGLNDGELYYAIVISPTELQLADFESNAFAGSNINLSFGGTGHSLSRAHSLSYRAGDVSMSSTSVANSLLSLSPLFGYHNKTTSIDIGEAAIIKAGDIYLKAESSDKNPLEQLETTDTLSNMGTSVVPNTVLSLITDIISMPLGIYVRLSEARTEIGANAQLTGSGNVDIEAVSIGDIQAKSVASPLSIAYGHVDSTASSIVNDGVVIQAGDSVKVYSEAVSNVDLTARTLANIGCNADTSTLYGGSFGISVAKLSSHAQLLGDASIWAGKMANIKAVGNKENGTGVETGIYKEGNAGLAVALTYVDAEVKTNVEGTITAEGESYNSNAKPDFTPVGSGLIIDNEGNTSLNSAVFVDTEKDIINLGFNHGFRTEQELDYLNGSLTSTFLSTITDEHLGFTDPWAIEGLKSGNSFYVIAVDPYSFKLALTEEKASLETPAHIDFKSPGSLVETSFEETNIDLSKSQFEIEDHGFISGQAVVIDLDMEYEGRTDLGVEDGETYYIIADNSVKDGAADPDYDTFLLATSENNALAGVGISLAGQFSGKIKAKHHLDTGLTTGVGVSAILESADGVEASAGLGGDLEPTFLNKLEYGELAGKKVTDTFKKLLGKASGSVAKTAGNLDVAAALALAIGPDGQVRNHVETSMSGTLDSAQDVEVLALLEENYEINSSASIEHEENEEGETVSKTRVGVSAAVAVGIFDSEAEVIVGKKLQDVEGGEYIDAAGVSIDAETVTRVISEVSYPWKTAPVELAKNLIGSDGKVKGGTVSDTLSFMDGTLGIQSNLFNSWTTSTASEEAGGTALAGTVTYLGFNNDSVTTIGSEAKINQGEVRRVKNDQTVSVQSNVLMQQFNLGGIFSFDLNAVGSEKGWDKIKSIYDPTPNKAGKGAFGGSLLIIDMDNVSEAVVEEDCQIYSSINNGFNVTAETRLLNFALVQSGSSGGDWGIGASINLNFIDSRTEALVKSGAVITGGALAIDAIDETMQISWAGGLVKSESMGIGASVSINDITRKTIARLGQDLSEEDNGKTVKVENIAHVSALSTGSLHAFSLAAAVQSSRPAENSEDSDSFGLGVSGAVGINMVDTETEALIVGLDDSANTAGSGDIAVTSLDDTYMFSLVGAVALMLPSSEGGKAGLAGAFAMNSLDGHVKSEILRSTINREKLAVQSHRSGKIRSITAGGSGARAGSGFSASVAGAVSLNSIDHDIYAGITDNCTINASTGVTILAEDKSIIYADAGGVALLLSQGGSGGLSFGLSVVKNDISTDTEAIVDNSTITDSGDLLVAVDSQAVIEGVSIAGAGTVVTKEQPQTPKMPEKPELITKLDTSLTNIDSSKIKNGIGKWSLTKYWLPGSLFGGSACAAPTEDQIADQAESTQNDFNSENPSQSEGNTSPSTTMAAAAAGALSLNDIDVDAIALISESTIKLSGALIVSARDNSEIDVDAGAGALSVNLAKSSSSGAASIGFSVAINEIDNDVSALIKDPVGDIIVGENIILDAESRTKIENIAVSGSASVTNNSDGKTVSIAGVVSWSDNLIDNDIETGIVNSSDQKINVHSAGYISIEARDNATIKVDAGGIAIGLAKGSGFTGSAAVGASVANNEIDNSTKAYAQNVNLTSTASELEYLTSSSGKKSLQLGDIVKVSSDHSAGGTVGGYYRYISFVEDLDINYKELDSYTYNLIEPPQFDLSTENFSKTSRWLDITDEVTKQDGQALGILISSTNSSTIDSLSISGTAAASKSSDGTSLTLSLAGAFAYNTIKGETLAYSTGGDISSASGLAVNAADTSKINADAGGVALAASMGKSSGALSVGFSESRNNIGTDTERHTVLAYISDSELIQAERIDIEANAASTIEALSFSGALAATSGKDGAAGSFTGSGAASYNKIYSNVEAYIQDAQTVQSTGDVNIKVEDSSSIDANAIGASVALSSSSGGSSVSISIQVSIAKNEINNIVQSYIDNSSLNVADGELNLSSIEKASINTKAIGVAVSYSSGESSISVSGGGSVALNHITGKNNAFIKDSIIEIGASDNDLNLVAENTANIKAIVPTVSFGSGASLGISVARNIIGWNSNDYTADYTTAGTPATLSSGDTVKITTGPLDGDVYKYIGSGLSDADGLDLIGQNYGDRTAWEQVNLSDSPLEVMAYIQDSSINTSGDLYLKSRSEANIEAIVAAGSAAIAMSKDGSAVSVGGAGVYTENKIQTYVKSYISGDGDSGISSDTLSLTAADSSSISSVAAAASVAASFSKDTGVSVAIGLSIAFNEIDNNVEAFIFNADSVKSTTGDIELHASSSGRKLFSEEFSSLDFSASDLEDAATNDEDDTDDEGTDGQILQKLTTFLENNGEDIADTEKVQINWKYTTADTEQDMSEGDTVKLASDYENGGEEEKVYKFKVESEKDVDLGQENYSDTSRWEIVEPELKLTSVVEGQSWLLVTGDGTSYTLENKNDLLEVSRNNISAVSAAASLGVAVSSQTGLAISGGGAVAINTITGKTNSYISSSNIQSAEDIDLGAMSSSEISATVVAASLALGVGSNTGVGVSLGIAVAKNSIGYTSGGDETDSEVKAYIRDSAITSSGDLNLTAVASQKINSVVIAGSAAIAASGTTGVAVSGSGVWAENKIGVDVHSFIDGDGDTGISANTMSLTAQDTSGIFSHAGAASIAAGFAGTTGVSVSVGVSFARNSISTTVESYIKNADQGVTSTGGDIVIKAEETANIKSIAWAASLAAGFGGTTGIAVSGAGVEAKNIILTGVESFITDSQITSAGDVELEALNTASIDAFILSASVAVAGGGTAGVGASIGVSLARNYIGYNPDNEAVYDYTLGDEPDSITKGDRVKITEGVRQGDVYEYVGDDNLPDEDDSGDENYLLLQDFSDKSLWKLVNLDKNAAPVQAYIRNTDLEAAGTLTQTVSSEQEINAKIFSGSVALSGGLVGLSLSGAGASTENKIASRIKTFIESDSLDQISTGGDISLTAKDTSSIISETQGVSIAGSVGLVGGAAAVGVALADNSISNIVEAYISGVDLSITDGNLDIYAVEDASIDSTASATAVAASISLGVTLSGGGAKTDIDIYSETRTYIENSILKLNGDLSLKAENKTKADADVTATSVSLGLISAAAAGSVADIHLEPIVESYIDESQITADDISVKALNTLTAESETCGISVSTGVSVGASVATTENNAEVEAGLGDNVTITAESLSIEAESKEKLLATSVAGSGALWLAVAGAKPSVQSREKATAQIGNNAEITVKSLEVRATHEQEFDAKADAYSLALAAGSGAKVNNDVSAYALVDIGANSSITADNIIIRSFNQTYKKEYSDDLNLYSASAGLVELSALSSVTDIGTETDPFAAIVNIGKDSTLRINSSDSDDSIFKISALTSVDAIDNAEVQGASLFGLSNVESEIEAHTMSKIRMDGAILENNSGDIYLTAKTDSKIHSNSDLLTVSLIGGSADSNAYSAVYADNLIEVQDTNIKANNVNIYAGKDSHDVSNVLETVADADITSISITPNFASPDSVMTTEEFNIQTSKTNRL